MLIISAIAVAMFIAAILAAVCAISALVGKFVGKRNSNPILKYGFGVIFAGGALLTLVFGGGWPLWTFYVVAAANIGYWIAYFVYAEGTF